MRLVRVDLESAGAVDALAAGARTHAAGASGHVEGGGVMGRIIALSLGLLVSAALAGAAVLALILASEETRR